MDLPLTTQRPARAGWKSRRPVRGRQGPAPSWERSGLPESSGSGGKGLQGAKNGGEALPGAAEGSEEKP